MLCPECSHQLSPIQVKGTTGAVNLDYCPHCGGVWSDQGETNFLDEQALQEIQTFLPQEPLHSSFQTNICPRDRTALELYRAESVPPEMSIFHCTRCSGYWFPEGTLSSFKQAQKIKLDYFKTFKIPLQSVYAVILPVLALMIVGGGLAVTYYSVQQSQDSRTQAKDTISAPVVVNPQPRQAVINFSTLEGTKTNIRYWTRPTVVTEVAVSTEFKTTHSISLQNLEPEKTYYYQLVITEPSEIISTVYSFEVE